MQIKEYIVVILKFLLDRHHTWDMEEKIPRNCYRLRPKVGVSKTKVTRPPRSTCSLTLSRGPLRVNVSPSSLRLLTEFLDLGEVDRWSEGPLIGDRK